MSSSPCDEELTRFQNDFSSCASVPSKASNIFRNCSVTVLLANTWRKMGIVFSQRCLPMQTVRSLPILGWLLKSDEKVGEKCCDHQCTRVTRHMLQGLFSPRWEPCKKSPSAPRLPWRPSNAHAKALPAAQDKREPHRCNQDKRARARSGSGVERALAPARSLRKVCVTSVKRKPVSSPTTNLARPLPPVSSG